MDLHLILAPGHAPEFATVESESKRIARERGGSARPITLPDTKKEFVPFMNALFVETRNITRLAPAPAPSSAAAPPAAAEHPTRDMTAGAVMARSDNPGIDLDAMIEIIGRASGYTLRRFASAVAVAFQNIAKGS